MSISYDRWQIEAWLGPLAVLKAREYTRAVSDLSWQGNVLSGKVQGTQRRPYATEVHFFEASGRLMIEGVCTCPVGYHCKHMAALLVAGLAHQPVARATGVHPALMNWLEGFHVKYATNPSQNGRVTTARSTLMLVYVIAPDTYREYAEVILYKARVLTDGSFGTMERVRWNIDRVLAKPPKLITDDDTPILQGLWQCRTHSYRDDLPLQGIAGAAILEQLVATGRAFVASPRGAALSDAFRPLRRGSIRRGRIAWSATPDARVRPVLETDPPSTRVLTATQPCWYLDNDAGKAGPVEVPWPASQLRLYLSMPPVTPDESALVGNVLREISSDLPPPPASVSTARVIDVTPSAVLMLDSQPIWTTTWSSTRASSNTLEFATVGFDYAGQLVDATSNVTLIRTDAGDVVQIKRRPDVEKQYLKDLQKAGFRKIPASEAQGPKPFPPGLLAQGATEDWLHFVQYDLPVLRRCGWRIEMSETFRFNATEIDEIDGALHPAGDGWFDVEMGITIHDRKVRLEPLLAELFLHDTRWLSGKLDAIVDDEIVVLKTDRNERLHLRADRLKPVVRVLIDLFDRVGEGELRISGWDAARLDALDHLGRWEFHGDASIRQLAQRLMTGPGIVDAPVPRGLQAELRPYQRQGLSWMQFLREHNLSGVLADDMGLGKTVQTLAHILAEKEAGRLDQPALIVVPTTLIHNWCEEARRFTPQLRVLDLHGPRRHERFDQIHAHDLVLTTYPLLWRDQSALAGHEYHLLILDEAQYVKNAATKASITVRELRARHRLCLTGTPLENHLGELWAQFDFLLPGFLGTRKDFTQRWRTPIEKGGDAVRRDLLARRIRPFMLRRRKDEVATELPPKTTIIRTVELEGAQRDLYETVRAAMQEMVRAAVTAKGLARSHLIVLEALLKLRQVCCDPRLVKIKQAARIKESAKLDLLLDMLPELIEGGRRILLFSQFTGMLDLIAAALDDAGIPYVVLTGDTTDRRTPVTRFQLGEVPLFLISLRAGGVGLNLTAADTVIHYDPWWNPAVENQATDRAHRLGQDKPVFVYKLITAGSVEEKIVAMQQSKAALADAILSEEAAGAVKFSTDDLEALFEPIPVATPISSATELSRIRAAT